MSRRPRHAAGRLRLAAALGTATLALAAAAGALVPVSAVGRTAHAAQGAQTIAVEPFASKIAAYGGVVVWSHWDQTTREYRLMAHYRGRTELLRVAPRRAPFDVDLGPDTHGRAAAVYSRCRRERPVWMLGAGTPAGPPSGCVLYRYDFATRREGRIAGIAGSGSFYLPSLWQNEIAYVRAGAGGGPALRAQPLTAPRGGKLTVVSLPGDSAGAPGPVSLDLGPGRLAFSWETISGAQIDSTIDVDTLPASASAAPTGLAVDTESSGLGAPGMLDFPSFASGGLYYGQFDGSPILPAGDAFQRIAPDGSGAAAAGAPHALRGQARDGATTYALYGPYAGQLSDCGPTGCALVALTGIRYR
jgi:hypothetical protein